MLRKKKKEDGLGARGGVEMDHAGDHMDVRGGFCCCCCCSSSGNSSDARFSTAHNRDARGDVQRPIAVLPLILAVIRRMTCDGEWGMSEVCQVT